MGEDELVRHCSCIQAAYVAPIAAMTIDQNWHLLFICVGHDFPRFLGIWLSTLWAQSIAFFLHFSPAERANLLKQSKCLTVLSRKSAST